jgi:hypothetical protein
MLKFIGFDSTLITDKEIHVLISVLGWRLAE